MLLIIIGTWCSLGQGLGTSGLLARYNSLPGPMFVYKPAATRALAYPRGGPLQSVVEILSNGLNPPLAPFRQGK